MGEKRQYRSGHDLLSFIKSMAQAELDGTAARASTAKAGLQSAKRALQIAHCEDFFSKMDTLLPTHESSRRVAHQLLARLCSGKPDLPAEVC